MASIAFVVTMTDGSAMTKTAAVSDPDVMRIITWAINYYPTELDANGVALPKTQQWAINRWIEAIVASSFSKVSAFERDQATMAALAVAPAPIAVTIS